MEVAVQTFYVGVIFSSSKNIKTTVAACPPENICRGVHAASLRPACHPIHTVYYHFFSPNELDWAQNDVLSACCSTVACAAIATRTLAAVGTYTLAIVNEVAASVTTRLIFFCCHSIRLCYILLAGACELSFRKVQCICKGRDRRLGDASLNALQSSIGSTLGFSPYVRGDIISAERPRTEK